jgi:ubiquinone/menaquinone biosynthesis C-methylase UbiE
LVAADFAHAAVRLGAARGRHRSLDGISWVVADVQAIGLPGETFDTGVCHMALFGDPDGNALMLHRRYAPRED